MEETHLESTIKSNNFEMVGPSYIPPPEYSNAVNTPNIDPDVPPSYESLTIMNQLIKARKESSNPIEYLCGACAIIFGSGLDFVFLK